MKNLFFLLRYCVNRITCFEKYSSLKINSNTMICKKKKLLLYCLLWNQIENYRDFWNANLERSSGFFVFFLYAVKISIEEFEDLLIPKDKLSHIKGGFIRDICLDICHYDQQTWQFCLVYYGKPSYKISKIVSNIQNVFSKLTCAKTIEIYVLFLVLICERVRTICVFLNLYKKMMQ